MNIKYLNINEFDDYLRSIKNEKIDFEVHKTTYTRKIKTDTVSFMFNETGKPDFKTLSIINKVKNDGRNFLKTSPIKINNSAYIHYFDLLDTPHSNEVVCKIDLKSAYWTYAIKKGVVTEKTDREFKNIFSDENPKSVKQARLKSLGSLATTKTMTQYKKGKFFKEMFHTEPTKELYIDICRGIDTLMRDCCREVEGCIYYYWDCMFVSKPFSGEAMEFFKSKEFDTTIEETKIEFIEMGDSGYILSQRDGKMYMVRSESKHLIV